MTALDAFEKAKSWKKKAKIIALYHTAMMAKKRGQWSMRRTALHFSISLGMVSESVLLVTNYELIINVKKRDSALRIIRHARNHS